MALQFRTSDHDHSDVFLILRDWLQVESTVSSEDIAGNIDSYHGKAFEEEKQIPKEEKEDVELDPDGCYGPLWEIWIAFIVIVEQIPQDHSAQDKLVDVIKGLKSLAGRKVELEGVCIFMTPFPVNFSLNVGEKDVEGSELPRNIINTYLSRKLGRATTLEGSSYL